jgi:hypothetical protein
LAQLNKTEKGYSYIEKIEWHSVCDIQPVKLNKQLELFLLDCFNTKIERFRFNGIPIDIKPLEPKVIGLPISGRAINHDGFHSDLELFDALTENGKSIAAKAGLKFLDDATEERRFCICFILEALASVFAPKANRCLEREYLQFFKNLQVDDLKNLKWCDLIAYLLIECIKKYKASSAKYKRCGGMFAHCGGKWCPFTLNIFSCKLITDELLFFMQNIFYDLVTKVPRDKRFP